MENNKESNILLKNEANKHVSRDTVLIRIDRSLKEALKELSKETKKTMSKIVDFAVGAYLKSLKKIKGHSSN
jgi:hypothetical protein